MICLAMVALGPQPLFCRWPLGGNPIRSKETSTTKIFAEKKFVVDKFHFPGHVDSWCQEHCNPNKFDDLQKVLIYYVYNAV